MGRKGRIYRLTGRKSLGDPAVPADYRRILSFIGTEAHSDAIRSFLRRYPDELIFDWLDELEELQLLVSEPDTSHHDLDFTPGGLRVPKLIEEDHRMVAVNSTVARESLARKGVYISEDRLANRPTSKKSPAETQILIVEDDPDQLMLAKVRVTMAGYAVRTAQNATALRETLVKHEAPDLLLLDIMLPDGDGLDILAAIRRHGPLALLLVVLLTVKDSPTDIEKGLALGADAYMTKPYSKASLAEMLRRVLVQSRSS